MKKSVIYLVFFIVVVNLIPQALYAKTGYVSDMLLLTFREGPGTSYPVSKTLKSDTLVTIIDEQDGFFKVKLQSEEVGWVDKKFIVFDTPKSHVITQLEQTIASLENKNKALDSQLKELNMSINASQNDNLKKIQTLETDLKKALNEKSKVSAALADSQKKYNALLQQSKDIQSIIKENKTLKASTQKLTNDLETANKKNKQLFKTGMIKWFLAGVATLLIGWILGQSVSSKKRSGSIILD
jgi:SH3 domain protein